MQEKHLYEYAVVRYVPRVEREEFVNVGLIMMCKQRRWLRVVLAPEWNRIDAIAAGPVDRDDVSRQLSAFDIIGNARDRSNPIAALEAEERFRWLTAVRSACIQTSRPHPGICGDLDATFDRILAELVL